MYFEVAGVSKHKLGGMRDKLKIQAGCGYGIRDKGWKYFGGSRICSFQPGNAG